MRVVFGLALAALQPVGLAATPGNEDSAGSRLRSMIAELVKVSAAPQADARSNAEAVRQVLSNHSDVIDEILSAKDLDPLFKEADLSEFDLGGSKLASMKKGLPRALRVLLGLRQSFVGRMLGIRKLDPARALSQEALGDISSEVRGLIGIPAGRVQRRPRNAQFRGQGSGDDPAALRALSGRIGLRGTLSDRIRNPFAASRRVGGR